MSKTFKLLIIVAMLFPFLGIEKAEAADIVRKSTSWTDNILTVEPLDLSTSQVSGGDFAPSGSVQATFTSDSVTGYFIGAAQHARGDKQYGMSSSGGKLYASGVTVGEFLAASFDVNATDATNLGGVTTFVAQ